MSDDLSNLDEDLLPQVEKLIPRMTKSDQKIAKSLLAAPNEFIRSNVRSIASENGVSEPTVVRFCRNVGCEGFKDLKMRLAQELAFKQAQRDASAPQQPIGFAKDKAIGTLDVVERIHSKATDALDAARSTFDEAKIREAAEIVATARRVIVHGVGGSSAILAEEVHNRLFRLGIATSIFADSYAQRMSAATLNASDVIIFVSSTGRPRALLDSLELAKYYGARAIAITDAESLLGREADICLNVGLSQSGVHEFQPNPMRYGHLLMIDILAFYVADRLGEQARSTLKQTRASVASLHGIAPQQPIGD